MIAHQLWKDRQDAERDARLERIKRAWDYYEGRHPKPLDVEDGDVDDNVIVNLARPIVDKGIAFLFGKEVTWQVDEISTTDTTVERWLDQVWTQNKKMALLHELGQNGGLSGMAFIKIDPQPNDLPRLINLDPATVTLRHTPGDIEDIYTYIIEFTAADERGDELNIKQEIVRSGPRGSTWVIRNYEARYGGRYVLVSEDTWPYPWPPIVHCKNLPCANATWGYSDLDDAALHDALNLLASTSRRTLRLHAYPQTIVFGANPRGLERGPANMWAIQEPEARVENLEMQSDLAAAREFYLTLRTAIYTTARMPDTAGIQDKLGNITNFGLRVLFADLLAKTDTKRLLYGDLIQTLCQRLAELGGYGPNITVKLTWPDPLPRNELEKTQEVAQKRATGLVSNETLTGELGYSYPDEQERLKSQPQPDSAPTTPSAGASRRDETPALR